MASIRVERGLRPCLVGGAPALFHMWEERSEIIAPSIMVGGHGGGVVKGVNGIIETEDGQVVKVHPTSITFVDQKIKEYCYEPDDKTALSRDIEAIIYHYCCKGCSECCNCFETGKQRECEYYMEQYNWLTNGSSQEVQSETNKETHQST